MYTYGLELLLWTDTFTEESVPLIGRAKRLGFDGVEIHIRYPDRFPAEAVKRALVEQGMKVSFVVIFTGANNPVSPDAGVRKRSLEFFKACIDRAFAVAGGGCVISGVNYTAAGYFTGTARTDREWEWALKNFREACRYAADKGIVLAAEALNRFETHMINSAADAVRFCRDVGEPNAKVHLDTYHMIGEEKSFYNAIVATGPYLGYFHACENDRGTPGTGLVRWEECYRGLKDAGYGGWITIESFVPDIAELARLTAVWRKLAPSADALAGEGLSNLKAIERRTGIS
jgi:D-psicose/D-tagatose/L-ribulose 3-epimerase